MNYHLPPLFYNPNYNFPALKQKQTSRDVNQNHHRNQNVRNRKFRIVTQAEYDRIMMQKFKKQHAFI